MYFTNSIILASLIVSASSLVAPHDILNAHRRHALIPRNPVALPSPLALAPVSKRSLNKRCKSRPPPKSTSTTHAPATAAKTGQPTAPVNAGSDPSPTTHETPTTTSSAPQSTAGLPSYMIGTQYGQGEPSVLTPILPQINLL
jgi:hypothetical protein